MIFDLRPFEQQSRIDEQDVAKRLMDYGFHAPTVSFPVAGTLMVEPTESEPLRNSTGFATHDRDSRRDSGRDRRRRRSKDNILKNAPHTAQDVTANEWRHPYRASRPRIR